MSKLTRLVKEQDYDALGEIITSGTKRDRKKAMKAVLRTSGQWTERGWHFEDVDPGAAALALHALRNDTESSVRSDAAQLLGGVGTTEARDALLHAVHSDSDERVRLACFDGMSADGVDDRLIEALLKLHTDENKKVRRRATWALGSASDDTHVAETLLVALHGDEDKSVRRLAAEALAMSEDPGIQDAIAEAMKTIDFMGFHIPAGRTLAILHEREREVATSKLDPGEPVIVVLDSDFPNVVVAPTRLIVSWQPAGSLGLVQGSKIHCHAIPYEQIERVVINEPQPGYFCVIPTAGNEQQPWVFRELAPPKLEIRGVGRQYLDAWDPHISDINYRIYGARGSSA